MAYISRKPSPVAAMTDLQLLTYLLTLAGNGVDAARVSAHALLDRYGDLPTVLTLPCSTLLDDPRLDKNSGAFLALVGSMASRYANRFRRSNLVVMERETVCRLLAPHLEKHEVERVCVICVDRDFYLLGNSVVITRGDKDSVSFPIQRVLALAIASGAYGIILAHSHPDGDAGFSETDLTTTDVLRSKLAVLGVSLLDHYLWTRKRVVSLYDLLHAPLPPPPLDSWDRAAMPLLSRLDPAFFAARQSRSLPAKNPFLLEDPEPSPPPKT